MARIVLKDNCLRLPRIPVSVLRLLKGGRSPRITRFGSNWQTDRTHQGVLPRSTFVLIDNKVVAGLFAAVTLFDEHVFVPSHRNYGINMQYGSFIGRR